MDDPAFLPQPGDWRYKLAFRFPLAKSHHNAFTTNILELGAWINAALGDGPSAVYAGNLFDGTMYQLSVLTDAPKSTFKQLRPLIEKHAPGPYYEAAYRRLKTREWTILWPKDLKEFDGR
jgi:hypothetical protein